MWGGDARPFESLLEAGLSPNLVAHDWDGCTLLMRASFSRFSLVELLLRKGAATELVESRKWTALMFAVSIDIHLCAADESVQIVKILLQYGAITTHINAEGVSAIQLLNMQTSRPEHVAAIAKMLSDKSP